MDYFFHVALELCNESDQDTAQTTPPNLAQFFEALKPFTNRGGRTSRNRKFDTPSREQTSAARSPRDVAVGSEAIAPYRRLSPSDDHRLDTVYIDGIDMSMSQEQTDQNASRAQPAQVMSRATNSSLTSYLKGHFSPTSGDNGSAASWGIVHLYRDSDPTPSLAISTTHPYQSSDLWSDTPQTASTKTPKPPPTDADCTTLCILAVPSYMTPADFMAFVGESTRNAVSHFRMVRTQRQNRYMVLIKFRDGKVARKWQAEWNGKIWNAMEPETCHVVFLKSVQVITNTLSPQKPDEHGIERSFPTVDGDPFVPAPAATLTRPLAPPTPSLIELPTCPVCLERMDETTGLLTIPCQHVFHCTCLQKWSGGGCPVCRYTHDDFSSKSGLKKQKKTKKLAADGTMYEYEIDDELLECETCHEDGGSLWQCLICGKVGCGRYEGKHAYRHYEETGHLFAMDLSSKRVWDYAGDGYVHRIMVEEKTETKDGAEVGIRELEDSDAGDFVPGKGESGTNVESLALEYTHLLTSQLESQRVYFEEIVERAVDKATNASRRAEAAEKEAVKATERLTQLQADNDFVTKGRVPELEKEHERWMAKARKLEDIAKDINSKYLEERTTVKGLMDRISHLEDTELAALRKEVQALQEDNATKDFLMEGLREEHRDAMFQVSAERQLREMIQKGEIDAGELEGAEITVGKKPLTARERLQERIQAERVVRGGKKTAVKGNAVDKAKRQEPPKTLADTDSSVSGPADNDLPHLLDSVLAFHARSNQQSTDFEKADKWTDVNAQQTLLGDMRQRMLELGLLRPVSVPSEPRSSEHGQQKQNSGEAGAASVAPMQSEDAVASALASTPNIVDDAGTGGRKKKGKGKGRGKGH
jgi:BRCA1-associated protein